MLVIHPKSLVAGFLALSSMVKSFIAVLPQMHAGADRKVTLAFLTVLAALCIWHAFKGRKNNLREEFRTSVTLTITSLLVGLLLVFRPRVHFQPAAFVVGALYLIGAVYYFRAALQERQFLTKFEQA